MKYQQRWPKTLALRHPSLLRFRPDKTSRVRRAGKGGVRVSADLQMRSDWNWDPSLSDGPLLPQSVDDISDVDNVQ